MRWRLPFAKEAPRLAFASKDAPSALADCNPTANSVWCGPPPRVPFRRRYVAKIG